MCWSESVSESFLCEEPSRLDLCSLDTSLRRFKERGRSFDEKIQTAVYGCCIIVPYPREREREREKTTEEHEERKGSESFLRVYILR